MSLASPRSRSRPLARWWTLALLCVSAAVGISCGDDGFTSAGPAGGIVSVRITQHGLTLVMGDSLALTAVGFDRTLSAVSGKTPAWTSSNASVAMVDERSVLRARAAGVATIIATIDGFADTAQVVVIEPPVARLSVAPATATIILGQQRQVVASAFSARDSLLTGRALAWTTDDASIATVNAAGMVAGAGIGTTVVRVSSEGQVASAAITVVPVPVKQVVVTPNPALVQLGTSLLLGVQTRDSVGGALSGRVVTFSSSAPAVVSVDAAGVLAGAAVGSASVTVTSEGIVTTVPVTVAAPSITLSAATATFTTRHGASSPAAQVVTVTNGGSFALDSLAVAVSYGPGQPAGWLGATLGATTAPATLTLAPSSAALPPGTYDASVTISSSVAGVSSRTLAVTLAVSPFPVIGLDATSAAFSAQAGAANPTPHTIAVTNTGSGSLDGLSAAVAYGAGQPTGWLTASLAGTTAPAALMLSASSSIAPGSYTATVTLASTTPDVAPRTIDVTYAVSQPAVLAVSSTALTFTSPSGGSPAPQSVSVTNAGTGVLTLLSASIAYGAGQPTGWLATSLGGTGAPTALTVTPSSGALPVGTYDATITVASALPGVASRTVTVTFTVSDGAVIGLSTGTASATVQVNGADPAPTVATVSSLGAIPATGFSVGVTYGAGASGWLDATLGAAAAPTTLTLQPHAAGLAIGTYTATATVTSSLPNVTPRTVTYTLTVAQTASIGVAPASRSFTGASNAASPAAQTVNVTNTGTGALTGLSVTGITYGAGASGWLAASLSVGTAPSVLTLTPTTGALTVGTYTAQVTIGSTLVGVAARTVDVTFAVSQGAQLGLGSTTATVVAQRTDLRSDSVTIAVTNVGTGPLTGLSVTSITYGAGGTGWLAAASASLEGTTAPTKLGLRANVGALAVGNYTATVRVGSSLAGVVPRDVAVTFSVADGAVIGVLPASAAFAAQVQVDASLTAATNVAITNAGAGGAGALAGLSVSSVTYGPGATGWLGSPAPTAATSPTSVPLRPNTTNLSVGSYAATVRLSSTTPNVAPRDITVTYDVTQPASITLSSASLTFGALRSEAAPATQAVTVTNGGTGVLDALTASVSYQAGEPTGWLGTPSFGGTTAPATLTLAPVVGSLVAGTYHATITVGSTRPGIVAKPIAVTFTVTAGAAIGAASTAGLTSQVSQAASAQDVAITNTGSGTLSGLSATVTNYAVTSGTPGATGWLAASFVGAVTTAPTTLRLQPTTGALGIGTYTADVVVQSSLPNVASRTIAVTFTVSQTASISVAASESFSAQLGGSSPSAKTLSVSNGGSGVLDGLSVSSVTYDVASGATAWLVTAALNQTIAPATLTLQPAQGALGIGTYQATVTIASSRPGVASKQVVVTLNVVQNAVLTLTPNTWTPSLLEGAAAPATQAVTVSNSGTAGTIAGLSVTSVQPAWLTASLVGTSVTTALTTTLNLSASATALAAGTYTHTVVVHSTTAGVADKSVAVTLTVTTMPVITTDVSSRTYTVTRGSAVASQVVNVTNSGSGTLSGLSAAVVGGTYTGPSSGWLDGGGALSVSNGGTAPAVLTIAPATASLAAGSYGATVRISSSTPGVATKDVTVTLTVQQPQISLGGVAANFTDALGTVTRGSGGGARSVAVGNSGAGSLNGLALSSVTYSATGATGWLSALSVGASSPTSVAYTVNTNVVAGSHSATVTLSSTVPGVTSRTITVTMTVQQPAIGIGSSPEFSVGASASTSPTSSAVSITNSGAGTLSGLTVGTITYGSTGGWIVGATLNTTTAPATLTIDYSNTTSLPRGTYTANIPISSSVPGVVTQNVVVTVTSRWLFADVQPILVSAGCAATSAGCHNAGTVPSRNMTVYANLVGVVATYSSCAGGAHTRVVAFDKASSLLYKKITSTQPCGSAMGGIPAADQTKIGQWIDDGAKNTTP